MSGILVVIHTHKGVDTQVHICHHVPLLLLNSTPSLSPSGSFSLIGMAFTKMVNRIKVSHPTGKKSSTACQMMPNKVSPSLEIFKTHLDKVLCNLL